VLIRKMIWKILSFFVSPTATEYHDSVPVGPRPGGATGNIFKNIYLSRQPNEAGAVAIQVEYSPPRWCVTHAVQFVTYDENGLWKSDLWLRVGHIKHKGIHYLVNTLIGNI